jgi:hypothetical protein
MIAHRLGTLERCDVRLEIEDGRLVGLSGRGTGDGTRGRGDAETRGQRGGIGVSEARA